MTTPKQQYIAPMLGVGDPLDWTSQAGGKVKRKTGVIRAIVPANKCAYKSLKEAGFEASTRRVMGKRFSAKDRYLVEVSVPGEASTFYLPGCRIIDDGIRLGKKPEDVKRPTSKAA